MGNPKTKEARDKNNSANKLRRRVQRAEAFKKNLKVARMLRAARRSVQEGMQVMLNEKTARGNICMRDNTNLKNQVQRLTRSNNALV